MSIYLYVYLSIYLYICIDRHREGEREADCEEVGVVIDEEVGDVLLQPETLFIWRRYMYIYI